MTSFSCVTYRNTSSTFSEECHLVGITTECRDVLSHPAQGLNHVLHSVVSLSSTVSSWEIAESSQSVVQRDENDVFVDEEIWAVNKAVAIASCEAAAMDPHHNRATSGETRGVHVQEQTVFSATSFQAKPASAWADISVVLGITNAWPSAMWDGVAETQVAYWRLCVWNSLEGEVVWLQNSCGKLNSLKLPSWCGYNWASLSSGQQRNVNPVLSKGDNDSNLPVSSCQQRRDDN